MNENKTIGMIQYNIQSSLGQGGARGWALPWGGGLSDSPLQALSKIIFDIERSHPEAEWAGHKLRIHVLVKALIVVHNSLDPTVRLITSSQQ